MKYSKDGLALTEGAEGLRLVAYQDTGGVWTIGYGHTKGVTKGMTCTPAQAEAWLQQDVEDAEDCVNEAVVVPITQGEFDALVDFVFNLGAGSFLRSTMLHKLNLGDYYGADNEFARWNLDNGKVLNGLVVRRAAEAALFKKGIA